MVDINRDFIDKTIGNHSTYYLLKHGQSKKIIAKYKKSHACERCGKPYKESKDLTFHHIDPSNKLFTVGAYRPRTRLFVLMREMRKCELLCYECHYKIHHENN